MKSNRQASAIIQRDPDPRQTKIIKTFGRKKMLNPSTASPKRITKYASIEFDRVFLFVAVMDFNSTVRKAIIAIRATFGVVRNKSMIQFSRICHEKHVLSQ
jgi:hypothetical protein